MKKLSIVLASLVIFGLVALPVLAAEAAKGKTHDVTVEFVSYDATAKTVKFKTDKGEEKTAPVMESAAKEFAKLHAGEKVVMTCQDNEKGEHQAITMVKAAPQKKA